MRVYPSSPMHCEPQNGLILLGEKLGIQFRITRKMDEKNSATARKPGKPVAENGLKPD